MVSLILLIALMLLGPVAWLLIGESVIRGIFSLFGGEKRDETPGAGQEFLLAYFIFGLLLYLSLVLLSTSFGTGLRAAALIGFAPALLVPKRAALLLRSIRVVPSVNFALWFTVNLALGASILAVVDGIQSPWRNNYGDAAWHIGMISSFVFGDNLPPQNHIFPPERLSYPFFVNLWSAALWVFHPTPGALSLVFVYQWMLLWTVAYLALDGNRFRVLPWATLFGGGAFIVLFRELNVGPVAQLATFGPYAHDLIDHGYPWVPFLDSVWLVQRPTMLGAAVILTAVQLGQRTYYQADSGALLERRALCAGLILGLSPLVHTHFFLVAAAYLTLLLFFGLFCSGDREGTLRGVEWFLLGISPAVVFAPWILGKSGIVQIAGAWMQESVYQSNGLLAAIAGGLRLWRDNGLPWLFLTAFGVIVGRRYAGGVILLVLFLLGNLIQFAAWNWDEIKIFAAIYLISISLWQTMQSDAGRLVHWWLVVLLIPTLAEVKIVLSRYERFSIYTPTEVSNAASIRAVTKPEAIIAAAPDHNSPVTLTGRRMFYGYEGTLHSHGLKYEGRQVIERDLEQLKSCRSSAQPLCPDYLYWSDREQRYWKVNEPGAGAERTALNYLYKLP